ncbi:MULTISPECIES: amino acid permease [Bacillaceae]|uniref:Amino acid permease n=1 Tax=Evansella alkalicola TaxID=745819 RepID=A0ABS6JU05_9BACI|nr:MULTISPECIES: amino acid permease [Bacillaceae]MBU9722066.1 amino acid permease [Bacillus alkalicola]
MKSTSGKIEKQLSWWQLSLLGVACTIGTGFFLGSSIAISMAGPSVVFAFFLAAVGTYFVYEALAKMTIADPQSGSFRTYAKKAYGRWAGFSTGWVYWLSELLIMGSQLTALSIFSKFWFPNIPLWIFACGYAVLAILVIVTGTKTFDRIENLLAVLKVAAILMFIILAILGISGLLGEGEGITTIPRTYGGLFPNGITGLLPALIFGFYGFAGIEIIGLLAIRLKNMNDVTKSGKAMFFLLAIIYITAISLALLMVPWENFSTDKSPFVKALDKYNIAFIPHVFNGVFIIAGFSTMVASLFAMIKILISLAEDRDAPAFLSKKVKNMALPAIGLTSASIVVAIVLSIVMPDSIYEYFTTAAGLMLLYNWFFIIGSYGRLHELTTMDKVKRWSGFTIVLVAIIGTAFHQTSRPGLYVSLLFILIIGIITFMMRSWWKKHPDEPDNKQRTSLFKKV